MSLAKINTVKSARKPQGTCEKCGIELKVGDPYIWFFVGFRSKLKHARCTTTACFPRPSERESSLVADVYDAQENFDVSTCMNVEEIQEQLSDIAQRVEDVAGQYRESGTNDSGIEFNQDSIERADILESAASELQDWNPEEEFPGCSEHTDLESIDTCDDCQAVFDPWIEDLRSSAQQVVDEMETP